MPVSSTKSTGTDASQEISEKMSENEIPIPEPTPAVAQEPQEQVVAEEPARLGPFARLTGVLLLLMFGAYYFSGHAAVQTIMPGEFAFAAPIFAFGLVAFGFLGMGPVTIAV